ncbi:MAG: hypothetical protein ACI9LY_003992, partial [Arenicella sp.]
LCTMVIQTPEMPATQFGWSGLARSYSTSPKPTH